jgi:alpha-1,6-mannosyltransferase
VNVRLLSAGCVVSACVAAWTLQGEQTGRVATFLAVHGLAFAAYLVAISDPRELGRRSLSFALAAAVVWRIALLCGPPLLSDDVNRYVWEGRIQLHGGNPYAWDDRPEAERWTALRDDVWQHINHKNYTAIYPPLWQLAARAVVGLSDSVTAIKVFVVLCELLTWALLLWVLRRRGQPPGRILILAWSPLALVEIAGSGHNEPFGFLFVALGLACAEAGRPLASALSLALGVQAKLLPGLVGLAWARRYRAWHVAVALLVGAALVLPYAAAGPGLWRSLASYRDFWRFNETLFAPLAALVGHAHAVRASAIALVALASVLAWRRAEPARAGLVVTAASLLVAANVLPWYALWLLPFLVLTPAPAALAFTGTASLAYLVYPIVQAGGSWHVGWDVRAVEYGVPLAVAVMERFRDKLRGCAPTFSSSS